MDKTLVYYFVATLAIGLVGIQGFMFYKGDCQKIKNLWFLVEVPGRCININLK